MPLGASRITGFVTALIVVHSSTAHAQPEYQGLTGGLFLGATDFKLDNASPAPRLTGGLKAGYRIRLFGLGPTTVSLTPQVSLAFTQVRGISLNSSEIGYSRTDIGGQLAIRTGPVRPYFLYQRGKSTIERYVGSDLMNYYGSMPMYGVGIEWPLKNPCGAGVDVTFRRGWGTLTEFEWRPPSPAASPVPGGSISSTIITVGWSGRFRGSRILFLC